MAVSRKASPVPTADDRLAALWSTYCTAANAAQASQRIEDGIVAGTAWRAWLDAFGPVPAPHAGVLPKPLPGTSR